MVNLQCVCNVHTYHGYIPEVANSFLPKKLQTGLARIHRTLANSQDQRFEFLQCYHFVGIPALLLETSTDLRGSATSPNNLEV